jgi:hypothetical protein
MAQGVHAVVVNMEHPSECQLLDVVGLQVNLIAAHFVLAAGLVSLNWLVNVQLPPSRVAAIVILVLGTVMSFYPLVYQVAMAIPQVSSIAQPPILWGLFYATHPIKLMSIASTFIAIVGICGILRREKINSGQPA